MNLGFGELLLIFALALLVFGPDKLPEIGKNLGRAVRSFRSASTELQSELRTSLDLDDDEAKPAPSSDAAAASPPPLPPPPPPEFDTDAPAERASAD